MKRGICGLADYIWFTIAIDLFLVNISTLLKVSDANKIVNYCLKKS